MQDSQTQAVLTVCHELNELCRNGIPHTHGQRSGHAVSQATGLALVLSTEKPEQALALAGSTAFYLVQSSGKGDAPEAGLTRALIGLTVDSLYTMRDQFHSRPRLTAFATHYAAQLPCTSSQRDWLCAVRDHANNVCRKRGLPTVS